jgi:phosphatidylinositol alpha-1,6-mannosyltransferase
MKTLVVSDNFPPKKGGSGRWFWEIYRRLPREQFVIAAGEAPDQEAFDRKHDLRVERVPLTLKSWGIKNWEGMSGYWSATTRLARLVRSERVGFVHCGRVLPEGVMALTLKWRFGVPYLCYVHGEDVTTARESREYVFLVRQVLRGASLLIANSRNTQRILCDEWAVPRERVQVLHPGVDSTRFVPASRDCAIRQAMGWGTRRVVLTVGRLQKRKGHDQMIRALRLLRDEFPELLYCIIGDGEERGELERLIRSEQVQEQVQLLGEADDARLIAAYQQCDLSILPNRQIGEDIEGFGMVLLEAQACGKPVIAGASGGTSEAVNAPLTGLVVPCETPEGIATAMAPLLRDEARRLAMGRAAREWAAGKFEWSALAVQAGSVFGSLARRAA